MSPVIIRASVPLWFSYLSPNLPIFTLIAPLASHSPHRISEIADVLGPGRVEEAGEGVGSGRALQVAGKERQGVFINPRLVGLVQVGTGEVAGARQVEKILGGGGRSGSPGRFPWAVLSRPVGARKLPPPVKGIGWRASIDILSRSCYPCRHIKSMSGV